MKKKWGTKTNQVEDKIKHTTAPLIKPSFIPCIYIIATATGIARSILSNLIQLAAIKAKAVVNILILFLLKDKNISAKTHIHEAKAKVTVWTYLGHANNKGDNAVIIPMTSIDFFPHYI